MLNQSNAQELTQIAQELGTQVLRGPPQDLGPVHPASVSRRSCTATVPDAGENRRLGDRFGAEGQAEKQRWDRVRVFISSRNGPGCGSPPSQKRSQ